MSEDKIIFKKIVFIIKTCFIKFFCFLIRAYQICISPLHRSCCRFTPSCSAYALEAIKKYGPIKGLFLSIKRILKCNPFHEGGYDPVP
ncbi:MAG: membrane protein insertion efficiency factor YidD [Spirochaetia bacterium]|nr:membrane protein insertion efficiency factor YidD [Spirochaetia bacterium]